MRAISDIYPPLLRVATVCTGNICRSPMAEVLVRHLADSDPVLAGHVRVSSAGTARWHVGAPMDPRARRALDRAGLSGPGTPAAYADRSFLRQQDLVLVMTLEHRRDVVAAGARGPDVVLWRDLVEPGRGLEIADPYYGDQSAFDACLAQLNSAGPAVTAELRRRRCAATRAAPPRAR